MLNEYVIASVITAVALSLLGIIVLLRNPHSSQNQHYLFFSVLTAFWLITNYGAGSLDVSPQVALISNHLTLFFGCAATLSLLVFVSSFKPSLFKERWKFIWSLNVIALVLCLTPLAVKGIVATDITYEIEFGPLIGVYFVTLLVNTSLILLTLLLARRRATGTLRAQVDTILLSLGVTLVVIMFTNAVLPILFNNYKLNNIGAFAIVILVIGVAYSIIKHKLFDIRLVIARSLGYILSVVALAALFGLATFAIINRFLFTTDTITIAQQATYTLLAVVIAFTFPPIKRFFDRITNKVFYRDAYDPQQLLNDLNKTLVSTIELKKLLQDVSSVIATTLKTEYALFDIQQNDSKGRVIATPDTAHIAHADLEFIQQHVPNLKQKVILADALEGNELKLQKVLRQNNIAVVAHLTNTVGSAKDGLGYLILGDKKSGNPYSSEDIKITEIITDELVIAVQNALRFDEIQNFNITLQEKVEDATRKLRRTNEKLKQLDQTKDDFISMASHQLRTPLTSVKGYVSMVLEGDAGKITAQQRKLLDQSFTSSQRMVYLIADLLNVSRLRTGKFVIEAKPTNLADVVDGEISQLVETAKGRDLTLEYHKPKEFPTLNLDETKIRQVIMNFVDNAIYYTPAGGHITVNLVDKPESIELTVVDDGLGVPKHEQQHLFTKFYRAHNAKKARPDGTGLGLFMAKKVIIAQGGAVIFKSTEGKGSTFGFTFPKKRLAVPAAATPATPGDVH